MAQIFTEPFWTPSKHKIAYGSKFLIATGIAAFYYFDPSDPLRLPSPGEFIIDNRLLVSVLALFLIYEGYKLYQNLNTKSLVTPGPEDEYKRSNQKIALQTAIVTSAAACLFVFDRTMAMDNLELVIGTLLVIAAKLILDAYTSHKKNSEPNDYTSRFLKKMESSKNPKTPSKLITIDMLLTSAVLTICLMNHPKNLELLAEHWEVGLGAGLALAVAMTACLAYLACNSGPADTQNEPPTLSVGSCTTNPLPQALDNDNRQPASGSSLRRTTPQRPDGDNSQPAADSSHPGGFYRQEGEDIESSDYRQREDSEGSDYRQREDSEGSDYRQREDSEGSDYRQREDSEGSDYRQREDSEGSDYIRG